MKKLIVLTLILSLVLLCGCNPAGNGATTTNPNETDPASEPAGSEPTGGTAETTQPIDWETPIDIDDSFLEQNGETDPSESQPTEPGATEPNVTDPDPTDPNPTDPTPTETDPTNPDPTEPDPTDPEPTKPSGTTGSKPIELPMVPG